MSFLGRARKEDLQNLATELGVQVTADLKIVDLKQKIIESRDYDEVFVKEVLNTIIEDRKEREEREERRRQEEERRRQEEERRRQEVEERRRQEEVEERRRQEEVQERRRQEEVEERRRKEQYDLERLKLEAEIKSQTTGQVRAKTELRHLMQKFDDKEGDISLYLSLFERQAEWAQIDKEEFVSHLLGLLPYEVTQIIAREPSDKAKDYEHVKTLLLKRFKLSPERFRQKFMKHQKSTDSTWVDFSYELENYCKEWVTGLGVESFEQLLDLMVIDQLKRRVPPEIRDHFLDEWVEMISSKKLAEKLDAYENVRGNFQKNLAADRRKGKYNPKTQSKTNSDDKNNAENKWPSKFNSGSKIYQPSSPRPDDKYEKRKSLQCYHCGSYQHLRPQCPKLKNSTESSANLNRISSRPDDEFLLPYTSIGYVNGYKIPILRDSGASIDIVCRKYITPEMLTGEKVWVQQPLDLNPTCLPLAEVELNCDLGHVITKAAIIGNKLDKGRYLLGNRTAALLNEKKEPENHSHQVNKVTTRAQTKRDAEQVFEKYGRLLRCDVKYGMYGTSGRRGSGRTGMAYAFVDYDDRRDAEDAIKYENGREIRGQSIVGEWARGPSYRSGGGSKYQRSSSYRRESYGRSSRQNSEECYRCRQTGHWARDCPELERDRYYPRSRHRSRTRSRSRSHRHKRSISHSRSRSHDRHRRSSSGYRHKSRSVSRDKRVKARSPSRSVTPSKSVSRSRSRSHGKSRRKSEKSSKKSKLRAPSKSHSRSRTPSKSPSRSPSFARKDSRSPPKSPENDDYDDKHNNIENNAKSRSASRSPRKSSSRSPSKENNRSDDNASDRSVSRSKSR